MLVKNILHIHLLLFVILLAAVITSHFCLHLIAC